MAGYETTLPITLDMMIYHARSVVRAVNRALVVVDLPFGTYQGNSKVALDSAIRIMKETEADFSPRFLRRYADCNEVDDRCGSSYVEGQSNRAISRMSRSNIRNTGFYILFMCSRKFLWRSFHIFRYILVSG